MVLQILYSVLLFVLLGNHQANLQEALQRNQDSVDNQSTDQVVKVTPTALAQVDGFKERSETIDTIAVIELIILGVLVGDGLLKLTNHLYIHRSFRESKKHKNKGRKIDALFDSGFIYLKREPVISTSVIVTDLILLSCLIACYLLEYSWQSNESINYIETGALIVLRLILRIPFVVEIIVHHYQLRLCRVQHNLIFPKQQKMNFNTYKEKVVYILDQVIQHFSSIIYMSHPNYDLAWCQFVIENDYLHISNSISTNEVDVVSANLVPKVEKRGRRFSKTISINFGQRNKSQVDTLKLKNLQKAALECAQGNFVSLVKESTDPELAQFDEYFLINGFNCCLLDSATKGNALFFAILYVAYKENCM